jgi:hypothetical protein
MPGRLTCLSTTPFSCTANGTVCTEVQEVIVRVTALFDSMGASSGDLLRLMIQQWRMLS